MIETLHLKDVLSNYGNQELTDSYYKVLNIEEFDKFIININSLIQKINIEINCECCHEIVKDYIDTFPEKSIPIKYCSKCFLTI